MESPSAAPLQGLGAGDGARTPRLRPGDEPLTHWTPTPRTGQVGEKEWKVFYSAFLKESVIESSPYEGKVVSWETKSIRFHAENR